MSTCVETLDRDVNLITGNRDSLHQSTLSEQEFIHNYRLTFCVEEVVCREVVWKRSSHLPVKRPLFVGLLIAIAMLQNGQMPTYIEEYLLQELLSSSTPSSPCVHELKKVLEQPGFLPALQHLPMLQHKFSELQSPILCQDPAEGLFVSLQTIRYYLLRRTKS